LRCTQYKVKYSEIFLKFASACFSQSRPFSVGQSIHRGKYRSFYMASHILYYGYIFTKIKEFPLYWNFYINILSQISVTITSSVRILYPPRYVNFYPEDGQDWLHVGLKLTTLLHQASFRTDLMI